MKILPTLPLLLSLAVASFAQGPNTSCAELIAHGRDYFRGYCTGCHGGFEVSDGVWADEGRGSPGGTPPLANSDFFMAMRLRPVSIILDGLQEAIVVNGMEYDGHMPAHRESLEDFDIAGIVTYIRAVLNDSTVVSCNPSLPDEAGFATCAKTARAPAEIAADSVAVWEVANVRAGMVTPLARARAGFATSSRVFRVSGAGPYAFAVPSGRSARATLRVMDAWGRTVWSTRVAASDRVVRWNGAAAGGRPVAPGRYVARFEGFSPATAPAR